MNIIPQRHQTTPTNNLWLVSLIAIAWWLLTRPYMGIWHDGILYTAQALKHLYPAQYAKDVFFLYGSQDDYTLFSSIHAWLVAGLGVNAAFLLLTASGAAIWLYALTRLLHRWLSLVPLITALILLLSWDPHYGGGYVFSFGERFASPRLFTEALVLLSLSFWLENQRLTAWCVLLIAALLHPLIALAGLGVLAWSLLQTRHGRPWLLWGLLLILGSVGMQLLTWLGLSPLLDDTWRIQLAQRSPFLFPNLWGTSDWLRISMDASLLFLAARHLPHEPGKVAAWMLPVFALAMLWTMYANLMGIQLAVAAQIYRVQWLAHLLAIALAIPLCLQLWREPSVWLRYLAAGIVSSLFFPIHLGGLILPLLYGLSLWAKHRAPGLYTNRHLTLLLAVIPLSGVALWLYYLDRSLMLARLFVDWPNWLLLLTQPPVALAIFFATYGVAAKLHREQLGLWGYGLFFLVLGLFHWDARNQAAITSQKDRAAAIAAAQALIPESSVVYWESQVSLTPQNIARMDAGYEHTWLWLGRAHYASYHQAGGMVFYRSTAMEITRRMAHLERWGFRDGNLDRAKFNQPSPEIPLTLARLRGVCSDQALDYAITDKYLPIAKLHFHDPLTRRKFYAYDCSEMRL